MKSNILMLKRKTNSSTKKALLKITLLAILINASSAFGQQNIGSSKNNDCFCLKAEEIIELDKIVVQNEWFHGKLSKCNDENKKASILINGLNQEKDSVYSLVKNLKTKNETLVNIGKKKQEEFDFELNEKELEVNFWKTRTKEVKINGLSKGFLAGGVAGFFLGLLIFN